MKEQLVNQLKTQIEDLERFIQFLQGEASSPGPYIQKQKMNCENCGSETSHSRFPIFNQPNRDDKHDNSKTDSNNNNTKPSSSLHTDNVLDYNIFYHNN